MSSRKALASGLAVSAFDYAAAHEFIRPGETGLLAPVGNETAFLAHAGRLGGDLGLRRHLATAAPTAVSNRSWDAVIDRFAADLREAVTEFHRPRSSSAPPSALSVQPFPTRHEQSNLNVRTFILSDIHLGTPHSKVDEVTHFLKHVRCERLILNGDIIDGWRLRRDGVWTKAHTRFIRRILTMIQKRDTEVIYLRGNHDDFLGRLLPLQFERLSLVEDCVLDTPNGRYLVLHGDVFDSVVKNMVFLAHLGDAGLRSPAPSQPRLQLVPRAARQEYFSLSQAIKAKVKQAVSFIGKFEDQIARLARDRGCVGVICGHIHTPPTR